MSAIRERIARLAAAGRPLVASLLLISSIVPIVLVAWPLARDEHDRFQSRYLDRGPLEPPAGPRARPIRAALPGFTAGVPVLVYHGIGGEGRYSTGRAEFARQIATLDRAGVHTISVEQYVAYLRGEPVELPARPILITFDDGLLSSYRGADAVLERAGMTAVMYVISGSTETGSQYYLSADELSEMAAGGRWEIQPHAGDGHRQIGFDRAGDRGSFYSHRAYGDDGLESFGDYRRRVLSDLRAGEQRLLADVEGAGATTFSFPFGDYGQYETNDPRIPRLLKHRLGRRYEAMFVQPSEPRFTRPGPAPRIRDRFEVRRATTAADLVGWLTRGAVRRPAPIEP